MPDIDRFAAEFEALTAEGHDRHPPFRWQARLFRRFVSADPPEAVDVPTGLGKTSVMALWLIALAYGAKLPDDSFTWWTGGPWSIRRRGSRRGCGATCPSSLPTGFN